MMIRHYFPYREKQVDCRADTDFAFNPDIAAALPNKTVDLAEAAALAPLGREERVQRPASTHRRSCPGRCRRRSHSHRPGLRFGIRRASSLARRHAAMRIVPPEGMALWALTTRFSKA